MNIIRQPRPGARFSRSEVRDDPVAPLLGEHSREVLTDLGVPDEEIKALIDAEVLMARD